MIRVELFVKSNTVKPSLTRLVIVATVAVSVEVPSNRFVIVVKSRPLSLASSELWRLTH